MKAALIMNVSAGSPDGEFSKENILSSLNEAGIEYELLDITSSESITIDSIRGKFDFVLTAGGDGTVNFAANIVCGTEIPLAVIPAGTLNHFARDIGMPETLKEALAIVKSQNIKQIDAASINDKIFVNNSSIGLYALAVRHRDVQQAKKGWGKWSAMTAAFISVFSRFPLYRITLETKGKTETFRSPIVFIGNNEYSLDLFSLGKRESLEKGLLSIYAARCKTRFGILKLIISTLFNRLQLSTDFETMLAKEAEIYIRKPSIDAAYDGEVKKVPSPIHYKIHPGKLNVVVPK